MTDSEPILKIEHLTTRFHTDRGVVQAVDDVSLELFAGETLGIVGESGCGKTVTSKSVMRLLPTHLSSFGEESRIEYRGKNLLGLSENQMRDIRGNQIAMIFQEPMTALNPVFTVGWQLDEALKYHTSLNRRERYDRSLEMLQLVDMPNPIRRLKEYPHQLSGGMRQRVMIAIALCCEPDILIADEPTTALDVTIQAQILRLMNDLKKRIGTAIVLITHDLGVVAQICDRVAVMYAGRVVEMATVHDLFHRPQHPYTRALLDSIPINDATHHGQRLPAIEGIVPSLFELPQGCRFHDRCKFCEDECRQTEPDLETTGPQQSVRCHFPLSEPRS